jgi:acetylcholinesterase
VKIVVIFFPIRFGIFGDTSWFMFEGGVHHTDDLLYLFPYPEDKAQLNADDQAMAKKMVEMWTTFAETGVPKANDMPEFKPMSSKVKL